MARRVRLQPKGGAHYAGAGAGAIEALMQANVRRLEAMRRAGLIERTADGVFQIAGDHFDRALAFERQLPTRPPSSARVHSHLSLKDQVQPRAQPGGIEFCRAASSFWQTKVGSLQPRRSRFNSAACPDRAGIMGATDERLGRHAIASMDMPNMSTASVACHMNWSACPLGHQDFGRGALRATEFVCWQDGRSMRIPKDLVPQKAVAEDLCVSVVTLWRARRSGIPDFPPPVVLRNMIFWKQQDMQQLEDALLKFEGRSKFEADRERSQRNATLIKTLPASKRHKRVRCVQDQRQMDLF